MSDKNDKIYQLLNKAWQPHAGQRLVGHALFNTPAEMVYVQCGRKFGKSEMAVYCCWLYALTHPNAEVYYLAPLVKQVKELVWANNRMQTCNTYSNWFIPEVGKLLGGSVKILYHEGRIHLPNGSFIKVDGSDNFDNHRGFKPDFVVADEFAIFKARWLPVTKPNMLVKQGKILFITTPPTVPNHATDVAFECEEGHARGDSRYYYLNLPSSCNDKLPHLAKLLEEEKALLYSQGKQNEWTREYLAQYVVSNEFGVIPQLNRDTVHKYDDIVKEIRGYITEWDFTTDPEIFVTVDPSNTTVFSACIGAYASKQGKMFILRAFQEVNSQKTSVKIFMESLKSEIDQIKKDTGLSKVFFMHNCNTDWVANDLFELANVVSEPSPKEFKDPLAGITTIKDAIMLNKLYVSDKCASLVKACELYVRDEETGTIPSKNIPLINCLRYQIAVSGFNWHPTVEIDDRTSDIRFINRLQVPQTGILRDLMESEDDIYNINQED